MYLERLDCWIKAGKINIHLGESEDDALPLSCYIKSGGLPTVEE